MEGVFGWLPCMVFSPGRASLRVTLRVFFNKDFDEKYPPTVCLGGYPI
jgi:hypothetical protein